MNGPDRHIKSPLSQEVLHAYLEGTLSVSEKKQVDQIIAEEPYYKEVLEGMRWIDEAYPTSDRLQTLQQSVTEKTRPVSRGVVPLSKYIRWAAAAIVLAAVTTAGLWITGQLDRDEPMLAQEIQSTKALPQPHIEVDSSTEMAAPAPAPAPAPVPPPPPATVEMAEIIESDDAEIAKQEETETLADVEVEVEDTAPEPAGMPQADVYYTSPAAEETTALTIESYDMSRAAGNQTTAMKSRYDQEEISVIDLSAAWEALQEKQYKKAVKLAEKSIKQQPTQEAYWINAQSTWGLGDTLATQTSLEAGLQLTGVYTDTMQILLEKLGQ